ncbi:hypothetical protein STEG23_021864, partial [Scotinomys teguina]
MLCITQGASEGPNQLGKGLLKRKSQSTSSDFHWFDLTGNQLAIEEENVACGTFTCDIEYSKGSGSGDTPKTKNPVLWIRVFILATLYSLYAVGLVWSDLVGTRISVSIMVYSSGQPLIPGPHVIASLTVTVILMLRCHYLSIQPEVENFPPPSAKVNPCRSAKQQ